MAKGSRRHKVWRKRRFPHALQRCFASRWRLFLGTWMRRPLLTSEKSLRKEPRSRRFGEWLPRNLGSVTRSGNFSKWPCAGEARGERTHLACCFRHLAGNVSQRVASRGAPNIRATPHSSDVEVLMAVGRKQMLSAFPPDPPPRRYPTLTRLGLVQRWAVLEIPAGDQLRTGAGTSRWFLGGHPKTWRLVRSPHVDNYDRPWQSYDRG